MPVICSKFFQLFQKLDTTFFCLIFITNKHTGSTKNNFLFLPHQNGFLRGLMYLIFESYVISYESVLSQLEGIGCGHFLTAKLVNFCKLFYW